MADAPEVHQQPYSTLEALNDNPEVSPFISPPRLHDEKFTGANPHPSQPYSTLQTSHWQSHGAIASYTASQQPGYKRWSPLDHNSYDPNENANGAEEFTVHGQPKRGDWKRCKVGGISLLYLCTGLVGLVLVIGAVVGGVVGSRPKSSTSEQASSPTTPRLATPTTSIDSSTTTSTPPAATPLSTTFSTQDTWITGDSTKTWVLRGQYDYSLFFRDNTVQMYEADTAGFMPQDYRWSIISVQDRVQQMFTNNSIWNGGESRPLYYMRNIANLDDERSLSVNDTIAAKFDPEPTSGDKYIPLTMEKIQDKASLDTFLWYFRPLNSSTELKGAGTPWTIHNIYKGDEWALGAANDAGRYNPGLQSMTLVGKKQNTWYLQEPIE